jgi:ABC-type oligopeptide transport system ATPase subunit
VVALWGQSGSGKSTLLQFVGGLDRPDAGEIRVDGLAIGGLPRKQLAADRRGVGFVFQRYHRERAGELATLRATEWDERALGSLVAREGWIGAAVGLLAAVVFAGTVPLTLVLVAVGTAVGGCGARCRRGARAGRMVAARIADPAAGRRVAADDFTRAGKVMTPPAPNTRGGQA